MAIYKIFLIKNDCASGKPLGLKPVNDACPPDYDPGLPETEYAGGRPTCTDEVAASATRDRDTPVFARMLLVHQQPAECRSIAQSLRDSAAAEVECTPFADHATQLIVEGRFDLVLIDDILPESASLQLADHAISRNTPVLLLSGHAATSANLRCLGHRYLEKPLSLELLLSESQRIVIESRLIVRELRTAVSETQALVNALLAEIVEAHRLFDMAMTRLGYTKLRSRRLARRARATRHLATPAC
ncbi:MAG TPA: hypothetical protein VGC09_14905 [Rhodopila sp.]